MCSRNTVRESSHVSFFCGGDPFCVLERRPENTHDMFSWVTSGCHPSLERPADISPFARATIGSLPSFQNYRPYIVFSSPMRKYEYPLHLTLCMVIGTYIFPFFVGNLLILFANGNICHSIHRKKLYSTSSSFIFPFLWPTLLMLSSDRIEPTKFNQDTLSLAKLVYHTNISKREPAIVYQFISMPPSIQNEFYSFRVLSTVQQTRLSWSLFVRKTAS